MVKKKFNLPKRGKNDDRFKSNSTFLRLPFEIAYFVEKNCVALAFLASKHPNTYILEMSFINVTRFLPTVTGPIIF